MGKSIWAALVALVAAVAMSSSAAAAPKTACPADGSNWSQESVEAAAATIWAGLLDQSPWPGGLPEFTEYLRTTTDHNGDGNVCLRIRPGDRFSPNSTWFDVDVFFFRDNNANGSND